MEKDIFEEDPRFGGEEKETKIDISFKKGFSHLLEGFAHLFKGLGHIFFKKFGINLLILLVLLLAVFFGTWYFFKEQTSEPIVTNITYPKCPELNCSECPVKTEYINITETKIYYRCKDGRLVTDEAECKTKYPEINPDDPDDVVTADDITFSIDKLDYSFESNNSARLLKINYTILNKRETRIMPRITLKMYDVWTSEIATQEPRFFISHGEIVDAEDWVKISKSINIYIENRDHKIRFGLQNTLPDPDEEITAIVKTLE